jgi:hypothetical protein
MGRTKNIHFAFPDKRSPRYRIRYRLLLITISFVCGAALLFGVRAYNRSSAAPTKIAPRFPAGAISNAPAPVAAGGIRTGQSAGSLEGEIVTIRPTGFDPPEITRQDGHFTLIVEDRSQLDAVTLYMDVSGGPQLAQADMPHEVLNWTQEFNLANGTYTLREANHPDWVCTIAIGK